MECLEILNLKLHQELFRLIIHQHYIMMLWVTDWVHTHMNLVALEAVML